jgi:C4-dicarboxylate transporter
LLIISSLLFVLPSASANIVGNVIIHCFSSRMKERKKQKGKKKEYEQGGRGGGRNAGYNLEVVILIL